MFNSRNVVINDGTFTISNANSGKKGIDLLTEHLASGAFHNSAERYDPPRCHPKTRVAALEAIMKWINHSRDKSFVKWLFGPLGSGKSAIAQTIAEMCDQQGILAASFFWSRSAINRNSEERLITSLAYQLVIAIPELRVHMENALEGDPLLLTRTLQAQMHALILRPMATAFPSGHHYGHVDRKIPQLIVLDGLDECGTPKTQQYVLKVVSALIQELPIPLKFLITSRFEQEIRHAFGTEPLCSFTSGFPLDYTSDTDDDIRHFLVNHFDAIRQTHPLQYFLPPVWPTWQEVDQLVQKSSGQFIYAATAVEFISSSRRKPNQQLQIILGIANAENQSPFAQLDALYHHIFSLVEDLPKALEILGCLFAMTDSFESTEETVRSILRCELEDVHLSLSDLQSVLDVPDLVEAQRPIHVHSPLREFLTDLKRSHKLYVDESRSHTQIAQWILEQEAWTKYPESLAFFILRNHCLKSFPTEELLGSFIRFDFRTWLDFLFRHERFETLWNFKWELYKALLQISAWLEQQEPVAKKRSSSKKSSSLGPVIDIVSQHLVKNYFNSDDGIRRITAFMHPRVSHGVDSQAMSAVLAYGKSNFSRLDLEDLVFSAPEDVVGSDAVSQLQKFLQDQNHAGQYVVHGGMYSTLSLQIATFVFDKSLPNSLSDDRNVNDAGKDDLTENAIIWAVESLPFYLSNADYMPELSDYLLTHDFNDFRLSHDSEIDSSSQLDVKTIKDMMAFQDAIDVYLKKSSIDLPESKSEEPQHDSMTKIRRLFRILMGRSSS